MGEERPRVGLVLSSGVARGMAHIGVLQVLQEERIPIDVIVGSSAGAIIGAVYAAGTDLCWAERLAKNLVWDHILEVGLPRLGFSRGERFLQLLRLVTKDKTFADLNVAFAAVAVDIERGEEVVLTEGPLAEAVLASASIPGVFSPRRIGERLLVDGSILARVPVATARALGADVVIAVDVSAEESYVRVKNFIDVVMRSIDVMMQEIARHRLQAPAEVYLQPDLTGIDSHNLSAAPEAIEAGRKATREAIGTIRALLGENAPVNVLRNDSAEG